MFYHSQPGLCRAALAIHRWFYPPGLNMRKCSDVAAFERDRRVSQPWMANVNGTPYAERRGGCSRVVGQSFGLNPARKGPFSVSGCIFTNKCYYIFIIIHNYSYIYIYIFTIVVDVMGVAGYSNFFRGYNLQSQGFFELLYLWFIPRPLKA